jgi:hypothetical protein
MTQRIRKYIIGLGIVFLTQIPLFAISQSGSEMPYHGIDSTRSICWRFKPGMSRTDPQWRILQEYELFQSDYLVVANCLDSSIIYTFPWKLPQKCLKYYYENINRMEKDSVNKYFKICCQDYYNDL